MDYQSVADTAKAWNLSERTVRNYCASGKIPGAVLTGKTWNIPQDAKRPERINKKQQAPRALLDILQDEMTGHVKGGIYHKIQIDLTYNSNHIEGSRLTHDQTRYIYETNTIGMEHGVVNVDDVVETANHFKCIDLIIRDAKKPIREALIKKLHFTLKSGTSDSRKDWFAVGEYKKLPNEVGGRSTTAPELVAPQMKELLAAYGSSSQKTWRICWNFTMPSNPSIRFRMETDGSGGSFSSKSVCGTTSCRSLSRMTSRCSTTAVSMSGSRNAVTCWIPA